MLFWPFQGLYFGALTGCYFESLNLSHTALFDTMTKPINGKRRSKAQRVQLATVHENRHSPTSVVNSEPTVASLTNELASKDKELQVTQLALQLQNLTLESSTRQTDCIRKACCKFTQDSLG